MKTIVYQSYRTSEVEDWITTAMASVEEWSEKAGFTYTKYGDEIFDRVPGWYQEKAGPYRQISTDLGRLVLARELLNAGYQRVIWLDADVLVFDPARFFITITSGSAFGREIWVQKSVDGQLKAYKNVHNAFSCFCANSSFLDFYIDACQRIVGRTNGNVPPQIVGTKLLTALHNMIGFQLVDGVGMASPLIVQDILNNTSKAIELLCETSAGPLCAVNLCASIVGKPSGGITIDPMMIQTISQKLVSSRGACLRF